MPFTIFSNSTTAYADEVVNNYLYLASGVFKPFSDSLSMTSIDNTYDIGSPSYMWNNVFCRSINSITSLVGPSWMLIAQNNYTTTARYELVYNFEQHSEVMIIGRNGVNIAINGDTLSNYYYSRIQPPVAADSTTVNYVASKFQYFSVADRCIISCKSHTNKCILATVGYMTENWFYPDKTTTITSLVFDNIKDLWVFVR